MRSPTLPPHIVRSVARVCGAASSGVPERNGGCGEYSSASCTTRARSGPARCDSTARPKSMPCRHAAAGCAVAIDDPALVRRRRAEQCERIASEPVRRRAIAAQQSCCAQQHRAGANARDPFRLLAAAAQELDDFRIFEQLEGRQQAAGREQNVRRQPTRPRAKSSRSRRDRNRSAPGRCSSTRTESPHRATRPTPAAGRRDPAVSCPGTPASGCAWSPGLVCAAMVCGDGSGARQGGELHQFSTVHGCAPAFLGR